MKTLKFFIGLDRVALIAIAISLAWHLFWTFGAKVSMTPAASGSVKISKVSFSEIGRERGLFSIMPSAGLRTYPERIYTRYLLKEIPLSGKSLDRAPSPRFSEKGIFAANESGIAQYVKESVGSSKLEPEFGIE